MKKIFSFIFVMLATLAFSSCTSEVDNLFDKSSAERVAQSLENTRNILQSAPNGWMLEYYGADTYGGYCLHLNFFEDSVAVYSEAEEEPEKRVTSHYKLEQSQGVVLSFDGYNENMHLFSDPASGIGSTGKGMEGDFEFRVLSVSKDSIVILGKKHGRKLVMTPMVGDYVQHIDKVFDVEDKMMTKVYYIVVGNDSIRASRSYRCLTYVDPETKLSVKAPYIITQTGMKFYSPIVINGQTISGFDYSEGSRWADPKNGNVAIVPIYPSVAEQFRDGMWFFSRQMMSDETFEFFKPAIAGSFADGGEKIVTMFLGTYNGQWGLTFVSGNYLGILDFAFVIVDDNTVRMACKTTHANNNGGYYYKNDGYDKIGGALGSMASPKTFKLTRDDVRDPQFIEFRCVEDPAISFTLSAEEIDYPFGM